MAASLPGGQAYATRFEYEFVCPQLAGTGDGSQPKAKAVIYRQRRVREYTDMDKGSRTGVRHAATLTKRVVVTPCPGDDWLHVAVNVGAF